MSASLICICLPTCSFTAAARCRRKAARAGRARHAAWRRATQRWMAPRSAGACFSPRLKVCARHARCTLAAAAIQVCRCLSALPEAPRHTQCFLRQHKDRAVQLIAILKLGWRQKGIWCRRPASRGIPSRRLAITRRTCAAQPAEAPVLLDGVRCTLLRGNLHQPCAQERHIPGSTLRPWGIRTQCTHLQFSLSELVQLGKGIAWSLVCYSWEWAARPMSCRSDSEQGSGLLLPCAHMCAPDRWQLAPHDSMLMGAPRRTAVLRTQHGGHAAQIRCGSGNERKVVVDDMAPDVCLAVIQDAG